jgi:hypothetical protein
MGISLLNLLQPGLGLFRVSQPRLGLIFFGLTFAAFAILYVAFRVVQSMTFALYFSLIATALTFFLVAIFGSIVMTWKRSGDLSGTIPWWSKWYGLVAIYAVSIAVSWQLYT